MTLGKGSIYRGYETRLEPHGKWAVYRDGNRIYTLETTNTEEAAYAWIDAEKKRERLEKGK